MSALFAGYVDTDGAGNRGKREDDMVESWTSCTRSVLLTGTCCMHRRAHGGVFEHRLRDARQ
jgi:hypothetical protein